MGKPYQNELMTLGRAYEGARHAELSDLVSALSRAANGPLVVVGSGGSFSTAVYVGQVHEHVTGQIAKPVTPLELLETRIPEKATVLCISANGRNPDILSAFESAALREVRHVIALCLSEKNRFREISKKYQFTDLIELDVGVDKDGFLATKSLVATATAVASAYGKISGGTEEFPDTVEALLEGTLGSKSLDEVLGEIPQSLFGAQTISVLFSTPLKAAAADLESRFVEAALGNLHAADFRNFAHGRHHWLSKRASSTAILALVGSSSASLAERTLSALPTEISTASIEFKGNWIWQGLSGLFTSIHLAGMAGLIKGVDPGRPHIPQFGRRLYHLRPGRKLTRADVDGLDVPVRRKLASVGMSAGLKSVKDEMIERYGVFRAVLEEANFKGAVLDYDGTLCDTRHRFEPLDEQISTELKRLSMAGVPLAIVTGRGRSAREELCRALPKTLWSQVLVGYYNGAVVGTLEDYETPAQGPPSSELAVFLKAVSRDAVLGLMSVEARPSQVSISVPPGTRIDLVWARAMELAYDLGYGDLTILRSGHSVDVLARNVSKVSALSALREKFQLDPDAPLLCIGDSGQWPGNDFALLGHLYGLSVDGLSIDPDTCWNLAPPGQKGRQGTFYYLSNLELTEPGQFRVHLPD